MNNARIDTHFSSDFPDESFFKTDRRTAAHLATPSIIIQKERETFIVFRSHSITPRHQRPNLNQREALKLSTYARAGLEKSFVTRWGIFVFAGLHEGKEEKMRKTTKYEMLMDIFSP